MIVRLYEVENARTKVTLHCAESILSAEETNLLEQPADGAIDVKENEISLTIKPYEIRTIRIRTAKVRKTEIKYRNHNWSTGPIVDMPSNRKKTPCPGREDGVFFLKTDEK